MNEPEIDTFYPKNKNEWRKWLQKNHAVKQSVWLIGYVRKAGVPTITWSESVDEALCYGWIDSKKKPIDGEKFMQFFSKRKARSTWSKINKQKVEQLIKEGRMAPAGFASIELAKQNGSWTILDDVEALKIPKDLSKEFRLFPGSEIYFLSLSRSVKKMMLQWITLAKRPETRQKRIHEIASNAAQKMKPAAFR